MSAYLCEWFISSLVHRLLSPSYVPRACGLVLSPSLGASNASLADCRVAEPVNLLPSMAIMSLKVQFDLFCVAALFFFCSASLLKLHILSPRLVIFCLIEIDSG